MYTVFKPFDTNKQLSRTNPNTRRVRVRVGKAASSQRLDPKTDMLASRRTGDVLDRLSQSVFYPQGETMSHTQH